METGFKKRPEGFATKAIHFAQDPEQWDSKCVVTPIVTSSVFKVDDMSQEFVYGRFGNPTRDVLEKSLATLDNAKYCLTFASGMGAISSIVSLLKSGDHVIICDDIYGGTNSYFQNVMPSNGVESDFVDLTNIEKLKAFVKKNTKMIWIETPTNPMLKIVDIQAVSNLVHSKDPSIIVAVDNTFLTPYFQNPLDLGADIAMYSMSKYINGHSDVVMGCATLNSDALFKRLKLIQIVVGNVPGPFDCYQVIRSLKTLALRMEHHQKSSIELAKFLEKHPLIEKVLHPGLPSHPQHKFATKQSYGHSGIISFYLSGGLKEATTFMNSLKYFTVSGSLGGASSQIELPTVISHAPMPKEERIKLGITDNLVRISVGLEDTNILIADLKQALEKIHFK